MHDELALGRTDVCMQGIYMVETSRAKQSAVRCCFNMDACYVNCKFLLPSMPVARVYSVGTALCICLLRGLGDLDCLQLCMRMAWRLYIIACGCCHVGAFLLLVRSSTVRGLFWIVAPSCQMSVGVLVV